MGSIQCLVQFHAYRLYKCDGWLGLTLPLYIYFYFLYIFSLLYKIVVALVGSYS